MNDCRQEMDSTTYRMHDVAVLFVKTRSFSSTAARSLQESPRGNSSSFAPHKLHFHCDSSACPAWQPVATLAINLVSENAVHLFGGAQGIGTLMKWLLLKTESQNYATVHFGDHAVLFQPSNALYLRKRQVMIIWAEVHF